MTREEELLVEQVVGAWRPRDRDGGPKAHPAWYDLPTSLRVEAAEAARRQRRIESAIAPDGLSSTGRAVLERIRGGR